MKIEPCPHCGKNDFETRRQRGGHVGKCPQKNGSTPTGPSTSANGSGRAATGEVKDSDPLQEFKEAGFEVVYDPSYIAGPDTAATSFLRAEAEREEAGGDVRQPLLLMINEGPRELVLCRRPRERVEKLDGWYGTANMLTLPFSYMSYFQSPMSRLVSEAEGALYIGDLEVLIMLAEQFTHLGAQWWKAAFEMDRFYKFGGNNGQA